MGFSITATHAVFFIAAIVIAAGVVTVATDASDTLKTSISKKTNFNSEKFKTDIKIIHTYNLSNDLCLYVLNTGDTTLDKNQTVLFVNGEWVDANISIIDRSTNIDNGATLWDPQEIIQINSTLSQSLPGGKNRVKVVVQYGVDDEYKFNA